MKFKTIIFCSSLIFFVLACNSKPKKPSISKEDRWVDSLYTSMSLNEKIGQLFMIATNVNLGKTHQEAVFNQIDSLHIGGLIFFKGSPSIQAKYTNAYQKKSKLPLFIAIDAEWGLSMRLDSTVRYPYNMTLGAVSNTKLIKNMGALIGKAHKRMGVHINFAPVVDINTNADNPVIGVRSYGENKIEVTNRAVAFTSGLQSQGVLACAKHFPGHGDTASDSHLTLPTVKFSKSRIDSVELYPYKALIKQNLASVMVAHLNVPSLEPQKIKPSTLSHTIVTEILKNQLQFKGLVFTDALNMKGVANFKTSEAVDLDAFLAGNDMLLYSKDVKKGHAKLVDAYKNKIVTEKRLAHSVKKILHAKYKAGLHKYKPIALKGLIPDLNSKTAIAINKQALEEAVTLIKKDNAQVFNSLKQKSLAFIALGDGSYQSFLDSLKSKFNITKESINSKVKLGNYDNIIISYHRSNYRLTQPLSITEAQTIEALSKRHNIILIVFGSQYVLKNTNLDSVKTTLIAYENTGNAKNAVIKILAGTNAPIGHLPASINTTFKAGFGIVE